MRADFHRDSSTAGAWCRRYVLPVVLALPACLGAQAARPDTLAAPPALAAELRLDANNSGSGTWMQLTPSVGYGLGRTWSVAVSLPFYYLNAASSVDATAASAGVGDALASVTMDLSSDTNTFYATLSAGAPTGNRTRGFGAGKATWDLSGYAATQLARIGPYLNVGVSNNVSVASEAQSSGAGTGRLVPGVASGNLVHAETGVEVDLGKSIYVTGSVYGIFASSPAATTAVSATPRRGPRGRLLPPRPVGGAQAVTTDDVSDHGVGGVLWAQVTTSLDLGVWITHSIAWDNYTTVSISANMSLSQLRRTPRSHQ